MEWRKKNTLNSLPISGGGGLVRPNTLCLSFYTEEVRYPETTDRYFKGRGRRYTGQEEGTHICFTAIFQAMERRPQNELRSSSFSPWYGLRGIPEPD